MLLLSGIAWALEGLSIGCRGGRGERRGKQGLGGSRRRRKEELFGGALLLKVTRGGGRRRRKRWAGTAAETVGENGGRSRGWTKRRPPLSERARRGPGTSVRIVGLTGGPHTVLIFSNLSKTGLTLKF
jgi:hypothetical protein